MGLDGLLCTQPRVRSRRPGPSGATTIRVSRGLRQVIKRGREGFALGAWRSRAGSPPEPGMGGPWREVVEYTRSEPIVMTFISSAARRFGIAGELFSFLLANKRWWMLPMIGVLLLFAILLAAAQSSAIAPFIYTLF